MFRVIWDGMLFCLVRLIEIVIATLMGWGYGFLLGFLGYLVFSRTLFNVDRSAIDFATTYGAPLGALASCVLKIKGHKLLGLDSIPIREEWSQAKALLVRCKDFWQQLWR